MADQADDQGVSSHDQQHSGEGPTRRAFVVGGAALGAAGALGAARPAKPSRAQSRLIEDAAAVTASKHASLNDIEHVVILMQENRSFDHYFGTMSAVRGYSDPNVLTQTVGGQTYPIFDQFGYQPGTGPDPTGYLQPFTLRNDPPTVDGETTNDIAHDWGTQHLSWNNGALGALALANPPNVAVPSLPKTSLGNTKIAEEAVLNALAGTLDVGIPYPPPTANAMPSQAKKPKRPPVPS